jgi:hypothetical protein
MLLMAISLLAWAGAGKKAVGWGVGAKGERARGEGCGAT